MGCHWGLRVKPNTQSLGEGTTASVVTSITVVIIVDALFAVAVQEHRHMKTKWHPPEALRAFPLLSNHCVIREGGRSQRGGAAIARRPLAWGVPVSTGGGHV